MTTGRLNAQVAYVHGFYGGNRLNADVDIPVINDTLNRIAALKTCVIIPGWHKFLLTENFIPAARSNIKFCLDLTGTVQV